MADDEVERAADGRRKWTSRKKDATWMRERMESVKGLEPGEIVNGWTAAELARYVKERDRAVNRIHGLGGEDDNPIVERLIHDTSDYDPHNF
jgi:hypothetical protein